MNSFLRSFRFLSLSCPGYCYLDIFTFIVLLFLSCLIIDVGACSLLSSCQLVFMVPAIAVVVNILLHCVLSCLVCCFRHLSAAVVAVHSSMPAFFLSSCARRSYLMLLSIHPVIISFVFLFRLTCFSCFGYLDVYSLACSCCPFFFAGCSSLYLPCTNFLSHLSICSSVLLFLH